VRAISAIAERKAISSMANALLIDKLAFLHLFFFLFFLLVSPPPSLSQELTWT
jgi:hypothetical protein